MSLIVAIGAWMVYLLRWQRKYQDMSEREWGHFMYVGKVAFFGWLFHFGVFSVTVIFSERMTDGFGVCI